MLIDGFRDLLTKAQTGDRGAAERLLGVIRDHLGKTALRYADVGQAVESTSDLVQEASVKVWQRLDQFRGGVSDEETLAMFLAWTNQIVARLGLNAMRDRATQRNRPDRPVMRLAASAADSSTTGVRIGPSSTEPSPSENVRSSEAAAAIRRALDQLTDVTERDILRRCFFEGQSLRVISREMNLSYDIVRERFRTSMKRLRHELEGWL